MSLYEKITPLLPDNIDEESRDIILFDPKEVYSRITLNKFKRWQGITFSTVFPNIEKDKCACGCGQKLTGRQSRWADPTHAEFLNYIGKIINGDSQLIKRVMLCYLPHECCKCHCEPYTIETFKTYTRYDGSEGRTYHWMAGIQVDHIVAVKNGGGGCWLGNYQFICHKCHSQKTAVDNQLRNRSTAMPLSKEYA